jgi:hypothetical protein
LLRLSEITRERVEDNPFHPDNTNPAHLLASAKVERHVLKTLARQLVRANRVIFSP